MEQRKLKRWEIGGFFVVAVLGTLLHFFYEQTGENALAGIFSPVNESVWEHLKLLFIPILIFTLFEYVWLEPYYPNVLCVKAVSALLGMAFIIVFYYTYTGIIGDNIPWLDIGSFYAAVLITSLFSYKKMKQYKIGKRKCKFLGVFLFLLFFLMFAYFTFSPPKLGLFSPPNIAA